jgi:hypothetical protein
MKDWVIAQSVEYFYDLLNDKLVDDDMYYNIFEVSEKNILNKK